MDIEDLIERYQDIEIWKRVVSIVFIAFVPGIFDLWSQWDSVSRDQEQATLNKATEKKKLENYIKKHQELVILEKELLSKESEFQVAQLKLPDEIFIDKVLQRTELIAKDLGMILKVFQPKEEIPSESEFKFLKLPIALEIVGTYGQIATFFDRIVHLEMIVEIENISLTVQAPESSEKGEDTVEYEDKKRSEIRLRATCDMMIFRSMTEREAFVVDKIYEDRERKEKERRKRQRKSKK